MRNNYPIVAVDLRPLKATDVVKLQEFFQSQVTPEQLYHTLDNILYEYSSYSLENELAFPDAKEHIFYLKSLRDLFGSLIPRFV